MQMVLLFSLLFSYSMLHAKTEIYCDPGVFDSPVALAQSTATTRLPASARSNNAYLQLGVFKNSRYAIRLYQYWANKGYDVRIAPLPANHSRYSVRIENLEINEARRIAANLKKNKQNSILIQQKQSRKLSSEK